MENTQSMSHPGIFRDAHLLPHSDDKTVQIGSEVQTLTIKSVQGSDGVQTMMIKSVQGSDGVQILTVKWVQSVSIVEFYKQIETVC